MIPNFIEFDATYQRLSDAEFIGNNNSWDTIKKQLSNLHNVCIK